MKRRLKFTITKIRRQTNANSAFDSHAVCPECNAETDTLTSAESVAFLESENPMLANLIADGKIHFVRTADGNSHVCLNSITQKESYE